MLKVLKVVLFAAIACTSADAEAQSCSGADQVAGQACTAVMRGAVKEGVPFKSADIDRFCLRVANEAMNRCVDGTIKRYVKGGTVEQNCSGMGRFNRQCFHKVCLSYAPSQKGRETWLTFCGASADEVQERVNAICLNANE